MKIIYIYIYMYTYMCVYIYIYIYIYEGRGGGQAHRGGDAQRRCRAEQDHLQHAAEGVKAT